MKGIPILVSGSWHESCTSQKLKKMFKGKINVVDGPRGMIVGFSHLPLVVDFAILSMFSISMLLLARYLFNRT